MKMLKIDSHGDGHTEVELWFDVENECDIDDIIEWLRWAKSIMRKWKNLRNPE